MKSCLSASSVLFCSGRVYKRELAKTVVIIGTAFAARVSPGLGILPPAWLASKKLASISKNNKTSHLSDKQKSTKQVGSPSPPPASLFHRSKAFYISDGHILIFCPRRQKPLHSARSTLDLEFFWVVGVPLRQFSVIQLLAMSCGGKCRFVLVVVEGFVHNCLKKCRMSSPAICGFVLFFLDAKIAITKSFKRLEELTCH